MTGARIQFIRIEDQVRISSWVHHVSRLTGAPIAPAPVPAHPVFLWQLSAANHRVLARGSAVHDSVEEAKADVAAVVDARERLASRMVRFESSRGYGWVLLDGGDPVLTCARWYAMERDRRESLRNARLGLDLLALDIEHEGDLPLVAAEDGA